MSQPTESDPGDTMDRRTFVRTDALSTDATLAANVAADDAASASPPSPSASSSLTAHEQRPTPLWEKHLASEFADKSAQAAVDTMMPEPHLNHIPVLTGGKLRGTAGSVVAVRLWLGPPR